MFQQGLLLDWVGPTVDEFRGSWLVLNYCVHWKDNSTMTNYKHKLWGQSIWVEKQNLTLQRNMTKWTWSSTIIIILNHLDLALKDPFFTLTRSSRDISFRAISKSIHLWHQKWGCPSRCIMDRLKPRSPSCWTVPTVCPGLNRGPLYIFKFQVQVHFILYPEVDFDCSIESS